MKLRRVLVEVPPDRGRGKDGGPQRNRLMLDLCDEVVAFWDGKSAGTKSTMARALHIPLTIYRLDGQVQLYGAAYDEPDSYPPVAVSEETIRRLTETGEIPPEKFPE